MFGVFLLLLTFDKSVNTVWLLKYIVNSFYRIADFSSFVQRLDSIAVQVACSDNQPVVRALCEQ